MISGFICGTNWAGFDVKAYNDPAGEVFIHSYMTRVTLSQITA